MGKDERNSYTIKADDNLGEVQIADEVVAIIAGLAAMEVFQNYIIYFKEDTNL